MKTKFLKITMIFLLLNGMFACGKEKKELEKIPFIQIGQGDLYSYTEDERVFPKQNRLFSFQDEWERFIAMIDAYNSNVTDGFRETEIDFENYQIIAVIDDFHRSGSYIFEIKSIIDYSNRIIVTVLAKNNSKGGASPQMESQPYYIVKMPKSTKGIEFKYTNK